MNFVIVLGLFTLEFNGASVMFWYSWFPPPEIKADQLMFSVNPIDSGALNLPNSLLEQTLQGNDGSAYDHIANFSENS
jgi:hypothetical protein